LQILFHSNRQRNTIKYLSMMDAGNDIFIYQILSAKRQLSSSQAATLSNVYHSKCVTHSLVSMLI